MNASQENDSEQTVDADRSWQRFVRMFLTFFIGGLVFLYAFITLVDPYDNVPFSLPMERRLVSISQRYLYPQIIRSGRFDSIVVGTSTSRLIDPVILNSGFGARFANVAMDSMTAWEQQQVVLLFSRAVKAPKALIVGIDTVWCEEEADKNRVTPRGFPEWLYDDDRWNDLLYLLNMGSLEIAARLAGYKLGLYRERVRYDGFQVFVPPEAQYDLERAHSHIWGAGPRQRVAQEPPAVLTLTEREALKFPALAWLDSMLLAMPAETEKILSIMPVHIAAQPVAGSKAAAVEAECKSRIVAIAQKRGAIVADWRIASALTRDDSKYWDALHYRLPIADAIARDLGGAIRTRSVAPDGLYRLLVGR